MFLAESKIQSNEEKKWGGEGRNVVQEEMKRESQGRVAFGSCAEYRTIRKGKLKNKPHGHHCLPEFPVEVQNMSALE